MKKINILLVDDEVKALESMIEKIQSLEKYGFEVIACAMDGEQAYQYFLEFKPNIVITDIKMPKMDGLELTKQIKNISPSCHVVLVSGFNDFKYAQTAIKYGVTDYLSKPLDIIEMRDVLLEIRKAMLSNESLLNLRKIFYNEDNAIMVSNNNMGYFLFMIVLGNGNVSFDTNINQESLEKINKLDWKNIIGQTLKSYANDDIEWYLINDKFFNHFVLIINHDKLSAEFIAKSLLNIIKNEINFACNIFYSRSSIQKEEMSLTAGKWQSFYKKRMLLLQSDIYCMDNSPIQQMLPNPIDGEISYQNIIKNNLIERNYKMLCYDISKYLIVKFNSKINLYRFEKLSKGILDYVYYFLDINVDDIWDIKEEFSSEFCFLSDFNNVCALICDSIMKIVDNSNPQNIAILKADLIKYIDDNFINVDLQGLGKVFSYNYTTLAKIFKEEKGVSIKKYILQKKIDLAKTLIANDEKLSIIDVAAIVGYDDNHYFSRLFRTFEGISPTQFKNKVFNLNEEETM